MWLSRAFRHPQHNGLLLWLSMVCVAPGWAECAVIPWCHHHAQWCMALCGPESTAWHRRSQQANKNHIWKVNHFSQWQNSFATCSLFFCLFCCFFFPFFNLKNSTFTLKYLVNLKGKDYREFCSQEGDFFLTLFLQVKSSKSYPFINAVHSGLFLLQPYLVWYEKALIVADVTKPSSCIMDVTQSCHCLNDSSLQFWGRNYNQKRKFLSDGILILILILPQQTK